MEKNFPLLRKVFEHISEHPKEWDQADWRTVLLRDDYGNVYPWGSYGDLGNETVCGTAYCYAGWAVEISGARWISDDLLAAEPEDEDAAVASLWWQEAVITVPARARRLLGLTHDESDALFRGRNTMSDIKSLLAGWGVLE